MELKHWILDDEHNLVPATLMEWAEWFNDIEARCVSSDWPRKDVHVSTVFLGLDHGFGMSKRPVLFETMIFGGKHDEYQERYCTWDEAEAGHERALRMVLDDTEKDEEE